MTMVYSGPDLHRKASAKQERYTPPHKTVEQLHLTSQEMADQIGPVTMLINSCSFQHFKASRNCETAKNSDVELLPGGCVFNPVAEPKPTGGKAA